jgi:hypothetical protein
LDVAADGGFVAPEKIGESPLENRGLDPNLTLSWHDNTG